MKYVLSMDGGGIRGVIPALVLAKIEELMQKPIADLFDMVIGTSTGGILALGLMLPDESGKVKFSANDLVELYKSRGSEIFSKSAWKEMASLGGLRDEKYGHTGLERLLNEYFGETTFDRCLNKTIITSYDIENRVPCFFKSWKDEFSNVKMKEVARATSAAPTFFEPTQINIAGKTKSLIDGGICINNPSVSGYAEALRCFPGEEIKVISLGTGELTRKIAYDDAKDWGKLEWMLPALSCIFDGVSDTADYQLRHLLEDNFIRLQTKLENASDDMDDVSETNIKALCKEAEELIEEKMDRISAIFS